VIIEGETRRVSLVYFEAKLKCSACVGAIAKGDARLSYSHNVSLDWLQFGRVGKDQDVGSSERNFEGDVRIIGVHFSPSKRCMTISNADAR
jgi:hypothetical protein